MSAAKYILCTLIAIFATPYLYPLPRRLANTLVIYQPQDLQNKYNPPKTSPIPFTLIPDYFSP